MCMLLMLLQNLTGINAINYYSPTILKSIGFTGIRSLVVYFTVVVGKWWWIGQIC